jgi:hypothetical protein
LTKRVTLAAVTIAVALLLLTAFSLQSVVLYSQIIQQSYAQESAASPITADGNDASSSSTTTTDNNDTTTADRITTPEQNASEDQSFEAENGDNLTATTPKPLQSPTNDDTGVRVVKAEGSTVYGNILQNIESEEYDDLDEVSELEIEDAVYSDGDEIPPSSPVSVGTYSSSSPLPPGNSNSSSNSSPFVEPGPPLPVEPDRGPGGQPGEPEPGGPTEPQQQPPQQTVDSDNNLTKADGILTATINGANFVRNQTISVEGKVDDADITPESGVWITVKDPMNEITHAIFVPVNAADKSFSYGIVAGYYDGNSRGFYKPMSVSGKNYRMTVVYNTDDGPSTSSTTTSSGNNKSEVQFVFAYNHSSTTPPPVSAAVTAEDTGPASAASQFAGNQSTTGNQSMTTTNMTTTAPAPPPTKTNGLLTASINGTHFTTNQTIAVNGTVREAAGPFIAVYAELKDPHNDTLAFEFAPIVRNNKSGLDNKTSFSYSLVAGDDDSDAANSDSDSGHNRRFWKPMNETGNNYTMIIGYATPAPSSPPGSAVVVSGGEYSRSEVQFVFAYDHLLPPEEEEAAAVATTTTTTPAEEPEPEPVVEPEEPEEEVSEEDGEDCDNSYPDECIPPPPPVLECSDIDEDDFEVRGSDAHEFDDDDDGVGCETAPQAQ